MGTIGAFFGYKKLGYIIRDCSEKKRLMLEKPKEDSEENRQKPIAKGRVFAMTHRDAYASSDVVTSIL